MSQMTETCACGAAFSGPWANGWGAIEVAKFRRDHMHELRPEPVHHSTSRGRPVPRRLRRKAAR